MSKPRTVEQSFNAWWKRYGLKIYHGPIHPSHHELERTEAYARTAYANGYRLGQRREAQKVRRGR